MVISAENKEKRVMHMKKCVKQISISDIVISVSVVGLISTLIYFMLGGRVDDLVLKSDALFSDYFLHIAFASAKERIYNISYDACFPPLAYCFYYLLWAINPYYGDEREWLLYRQETNNLLIFVIYNMIIAVFIIYCVQMILKEYTNQKSLLLSILIICSYPFLATSIQRGNATAIVGILLCFALVWKDSESKVLRELALIFIAVAAGFKIYPAFVGIIYIIEKRYKEVFRLVIYGILLFFVPFIFFGGIDGFKNFIWLLIGREQEIVTRWGTIRGITNHYWLSSLGEKASNTIGFVLENLYILCAILAAWVCKKNWKRVFIITSVLVVYVQVNWMYTLAYLLPAFLFFLKEEGGKRDTGLADIVYAIAWGIIYSLPAWMLIVFKDGIYEGIYKVLYLLLGICIVSEIWNFVSKKSAGTKAKIQNGELSV